MHEPEAYAQALAEFHTLSHREAQLTGELMHLRVRTAHLVGLLLPADAPDSSIEDVLCGPAVDRRHNVNAACL